MSIQCQWLLNANRSQGIFKIQPNLLSAIKIKLTLLSLKGFFKFSIATYIQYYLVLVSAAQHNGYIQIYIYIYLIKYIQSYTLQSGSFDISSAHPAPHIVIITLLTILPKPYFIDVCVYLRVI